MSQQQVNQGLLMAININQGLLKRVCPPYTKVDLFPTMCTRLLYTRIKKLHIIMFKYIVYTIYKLYDVFKVISYTVSLPSTSPFKIT